MSVFSAFSARPLDPVDLPQARSLATASGLHGVYVANSLETDEGDVLAFYGAEDLPALAWFGTRGNLIVLQQRELPADSMAQQIRRSGFSWRIVLGPPAVVDALLQLCQGSPLVHREQVYYGVRPTDVPVDLIRSDVRRPVKADLASLMTAALELNEVDLRVDPKRVDRGWLRRTVRRRIVDGSTRVIGPVGRPAAKLDIGSDGAAGCILEGVFTFPEARGKGLATSLVATTAAGMVDHAPVVSLHVAGDNAVARAAYERAGMRQDGHCSLMLLG